MQLANLLSRLHGRSIDASVISLTSVGPVSPLIEELGVPIWHLGIEKATRLPAAVARLISISRAVRPHAVQGWMYHGNLAATWARGGSRGCPHLFWGIRQSLSDIANENPLSRQVIRLSARLSSQPDAIVYNSHSSRAQHEKFGFSSKDARIIDNGFDTNRFRPNPAVRRAVRQELGLAPDTLLIGLIARFHPMKRHTVFLEAAALLAARRPEIHFLLVGREVTADNPFFSPWLDTVALHGRLHLLGERVDLPQLTASLDIASSSSGWGEGFSNALGEAMCCGVPCVATDVGDARRIVGTGGVIVDNGDTRALADAWEGLLDLPSTARDAIGAQARERMRSSFSLEAVADSYATLLGKNV